MRVAQIVHALNPGGAQKLQVTFAQVAGRRGLDVTVINLRESGDTPIPDELRAAGANVVTLHGDTLRDRRRWRALTSLLRAERFDVAQTHIESANILGVAACRLTGTPVVATLHSVGIDPKHHSRARRQLETWALRYGAQRVVAVGHTIAAAHQLRLGGRRIDVVPNAVIPPTPLSRAEREAARRELARDPSRPILISVGRLSAPKGYPDLLDAFALVRRRHPEAALVIAGGGELRRELDAAIERLGLRCHASLLGPRADVPRLLSAADMFVSSSHWEGLPLAVLEAQAAGLPVVATAVGDVPRVVVEDAGLVVPPRAPRELADAISALLDDPARMAAYGRAGHCHAVSDYSPDAWLDRLLALYAELPRRRGASPVPRASS